MLFWILLFLTALFGGVKFGYSALLAIRGVILR